MHTHPTKPDIPKPDNGEIVAGIEQLVADHHRCVYGYAFRLSGNQADAEDITQETFLSAQRSLASLQTAEKAKAWLLTIARNCFLKSIRRQRPTAAAVLDVDLQLFAIEDATTEYDFEQLQLALDSLPEDFRTVVLMHYFEFLSYEQIADALEVPKGTIMSRLSRAKQKLRITLTKKKETAETR